MISIGLLKRTFKYRVNNNQQGILPTNLAELMLLHIGVHQLICLNI